MKKIFLETFVNNFIRELGLKEKDTYTINHSFIGNRIESYDINQDELIDATKDAYRFFKEESIHYYYNKKNIYQYYNLVSLQYLGYYDIKKDKYYLIDKNIKLIINEGFFNIIYNLGLPKSFLNKK